MQTNQKQAINKGIESGRLPSKIKMKTSKMKINSNFKKIMRKNAASNTNHTQE